MKLDTQDGLCPVTLYSATLHLWQGSCIEDRVDSSPFTTLYYTSKQVGFIQGTQSPAVEGGTLCSACSYSFRYSIISTITIIRTYKVVLHEIITINESHTKT